MVRQPDDNVSVGVKDIAAPQRVLLVDDEPSIVRSLRRLLRSEPYELLTAESGDEALDVMEHQVVDLIISDQRMPGMTGTELFSEVLKRWPQTIRIVLSGYSEVTAILKSVNEGAIYKYITKPWNDEELKLHIRRALEQRALEVRNRELLKQVEKQNRRLAEMNHILDQRADDASFGLTFTQELFESIDAAVLCMDPDGLVVGANERVWELVPLKRPELIGTSAYAVLPKALLEAITDQPEAEDQVRCGSLDFAERAVQWRSRSLRDGTRLKGRVITIWERVA